MREWKGQKRLRARARPRCPVSDGRDDAWLQAARPVTVDNVTSYCDTVDGPPPLLGE